jgi:hypothetical protein
LGHELQQVYAVCCPECTRVSGGTSWGPEAAEEGIWPICRGYTLELDDSPESDPIRANFYQSQIGILRWCVELGRIVIITKVSMFYTHLLLLREGHLEAVFHVFAYLVLHHNVKVVFDLIYPYVDTGTFITTDWKSMYGEVKEMIPSDAPFLLGKKVDMRLFVESDHADEQFTRR